MRPSLQALMKKIKGKTVFIIGGGPSAQDVNFDLLQDELVICINDAYRDFPNAAMIYWVDNNWVSENYDILNSHKCKLRFTSKVAHHISYAKKPDPQTLCGGFVLKRTGDSGFDPAPDCLMGNNSGVQVLNLVVNMKPKNVILIGYDMKRVGKKSHYHNQKRPYVGDNIYSGQFAPSLGALAKGMKASGSRVNVINANPDSAVKCFNFGVYTDFLKH